MSRRANRRTPGARPSDPRRTPRRRTALVSAIAVAVVAALGFWLWRTVRVTPVGAGPIVLISIDTLRADRLPAYGYRAIATPQIDRLAADAVLFENAWSHSPQTLPSHTSILSGLLPFEHGVRDNIGFTVTDHVRFLQDALHDAGYATAGFVSAYVLRHQTGFGRGFDLFDDELPPASPELPLGQVQRPGEQTVAAAVRWIDRQTAAKFFLFVHIYEPHRPYAPPSRFAAVSPYDGEVEYSDEIVGRLLDHLRDKRLYDPATIVLLSDHGEGLGAHGEDEHGIFLYRETTHVPLLVKLPGARRGGRRVAAAVQHIDVAPTILQLAGAAVPGTLKGRALGPLLDGSGSVADASIYAESLSPRYHFGWSELYALTDDRYRLIRAPRDELYDIGRDPHEQTSIADERPQVRAAMRRALDRLVAGATPRAPSAVSDADRQKLAALGYIGTSSAAPLSLPADQLPDPKDRVGILQQYKHATDLAGNRQYAEATQAFKEVLRAEPQMTDVWIQLAGLYERSGRFTDAVGAFKEVIARNPRDPSALIGAASGLMRLGDLAGARAHAELAREVAPAAAHEMLARIAVEQGDAATARREAELTRAADPSVPMPAMVEGLLLHRRGEYALALPQFEAAQRALATRTVQMPELHYYIGDCLARLDRHDEAARAFNAEIAMFPANLRARAGLAMLYRVTGRDQQAEQAIADLLRVSPTREGYSLAAQLWTMFGEAGKAAAARAEAARRPG